MGEVTHETNGAAGGTALPARQAAAWERIKAFTAERGRGPTISELSRLFSPSITTQAAHRLVDKLRLRGLVGPAPVGGVLNVSGTNRVDKPLAVLSPDAECVGLLREADEIFRTIAVMDRPRRDAWRRRAAAYLATGGPPPGVA